MERAGSYARTMKSFQNKGSRSSLKLLVTWVIFAPMLWVSPAAISADDVRQMVKSPAWSSLADDRIVAIRRVNIVDRELDKDGEWTDVRRKYIEIEIAINKVDSGSNLEHVLQIGDREFASNGWTQEMHLLYLLEPREFAGLKDEAIVRYRVGVVQGKESIDELRPSGRDFRSSGKSVGKLRKAMVDDFAPLDRKPNLMPLN